MFSELKLMKDRNDSFLFQKKIYMIEAVSILKVQLSKYKFRLLSNSTMSQRSKTCCQIVKSNKLKSDEKFKYLNCRKKVKLIYLNSKGQVLVMCYKSKKKRNLDSLIGMCSMCVCRSQMFGGRIAIRLYIIQCIILYYTQYVINSLYYQY